MDIKGGWTEKDAYVFTLLGVIFLNLIHCKCTVRSVGKGVFTHRIYHKAHRKDKLSYIFITAGHSAQCARRIEVFAANGLLVHQPRECNLLTIIALLTSSQLCPDYVGIELGIGESLLVKAIAESTGRSQSLIKAELKEEGDLGLVAMASPPS